MGFTDEIAWTRLLIGDPATGANNPDPDARESGIPQISDQNIQNFLDQFTSLDSRTRVYSAAVDILESFAASAIERSIQASAGGTWTHDSRKLAENYRQQAARYRSTLENTPSAAVAEINWGHNELVIRRNSILRSNR